MAEGWVVVDVQVSVSNRKSMGGGRGRNNVENSVCRFEPRSCAYVIASFS